MANLSPISTTLAKLVANLPPVSLIPVEKFAADVVYTCGKFTTGVIDTGGAP
jgi:hypothetical protein